MTDDEPHGSGVALDTSVLTDWLAERAEITPPLESSQISGGRSNLTYRVTDADGRAFALRRPPLGELLPGAHDMSREYRVMAALEDSDVPVPPVVGLCTDASVMGAEFYVMQFVDAGVVRTRADAEQLERSVRQQAAVSLADTLAALHAIDPATVGLGPSDRGEDYLARQLHVWNRQLQAQRGRDLPQLDDVHRRLAEAIPPQSATAIVHGDYRLDNVMLDPEGNVAAVLDWELWTLGDPLADLAITMTYWTDSEDGAAAVIGQPTTVSGFGSSEAFRQTYTTAGGHAMQDELVPYYLAFGVWRLAAILEGVYQRNRAGAYGVDDGDWQQFKGYVPRMAAQAAAYANEAGI